MAKLSAKVQAMVDRTGKLPAFTSVGSYPTFYMNKKDEVFCAKCANDPELDETITAGDVHWEGEPLECDECHENIESAYGGGDDDGEDEDEDEDEGEDDDEPDEE